MSLLILQMFLTIQLILNRIYTDELNIFSGFDRITMKKLLTICTKESYFLFDVEFCNQIDGVSIGSPLEPLFENVFMADFQKSIGTK